MTKTATRGANKMASSQSRLHRTKSGRPMRTHRKGTAIVSACWLVAVWALVVVLSQISFVRDHATVIIGVVLSLSPLIVRRANLLWRKAVRKASRSASATSHSHSEGFSEAPTQQIVRDDAAAAGPPRRRAGSEAFSGVMPPSQAQTQQSAPKYSQVTGPGVRGAAPYPSRDRRRFEPEPEEPTNHGPRLARRIDPEPEEPTDIAPNVQPSVDQQTPITVVPQRLQGRLRFESGSWTDIGPRQENQDRELTRPRFLAIADGVGGRSSGAAAARLALETVEQIMANPHANPGEAVAAANAALRSQQIDDAVDSGRATTLDIVSLDEADDLTGAHVGDSRVYVLPNDSSQLVRLTTDHAQGNRLTRSIGGSDSVAPDVWVYEANIGDLILVATDGLWKGGFDEHAIGRLMRAGRGNPPPEIARVLVETASQRAVDNITVIVAKVVSNRMLELPHTR